MDTKTQFLKTLGYIFALQKSFLQCDVCKSFTAKVNDAENWNAWSGLKQDSWTKANSVSFQWHFLLELKKCWQIKTFALEILKLYGLHWWRVLWDIKDWGACAILEQYLGIGHSHTESPCSRWNSFIRDRRYPFPLAQGIFIKVFFWNFSTNTSEIKSKECIQRCLWWRKKLPHLMHQFVEFHCRGSLKRR